jgi:hypothetical protein
MDFTVNNGLSMTGGDDISDIQTEIDVLNDTVVFKAGAQTITGVKTFSPLPRSSTVPSYPIDLTNKSYVDTKVSLTLDQTINDVKTFSQLPRCSAEPTLNYQLANKQYVDNHLIGAFVDLTTNQTIAGNKTFTGNTTLITSGAGNNVLNIQGTGKNQLICQGSGDNEITTTTGSNIISTSTAGANYLRVGLIDKISITNSVTTINSALTITNNGAPSIRLNGNNTDGSYFTLYPDGSTRRAYFGFPGLGNVKFTIANEYTNGEIESLINGAVKSSITATATTLTNGTTTINCNTGNFNVNATGDTSINVPNGRLHYLEVNGVDKVVIGQNSTTLTNVANNITATTGANTLRSAKTTADANLIDATGTGGGNTIQTTTGQNLLITNTGTNKLLTYNATALANLIDAQQIGGGNTIRTQTGQNLLTSSTGTNKMTTGNTAADANLIEATGTGGGNTMRTTTGMNFINSTNGGVNLIQTTGGITSRNDIYSNGTAFNANQLDANLGGNHIRAADNNTITSRTGNNLLTVNSGDGGNVLKAIGTGTYGGGYNSIIGRNNYYDVTPGSHYIRTGAQGSEVNKIVVNPTTTSMNNTNLLITMGDQFTVDCFINRMRCSNGGYHSFTVNGFDKLVLEQTISTMTNTNILIYSVSSYTNSLGGDARIYFDGGSCSYKFNSYGLAATRWRMYDNGTTNTVYFLQGAAVNGVYLGNGANGWSAWSDERIKKNIKPIDTALTDILKLKPVFYNYKGDEDTQALRAGFIAQEVQQVYPDIINESNMDSGDIKNLLGLDMTNLVPYLVKAIQDLNKKVEEQSLIINQLILKNS